ncbi:MAG: xylose isomerase, partial [Flavisolibacter sp.]
MQRRKFIRNGLATGVTGLISSSVFASNERKEKSTSTYDGKPFHLYYGIHDGMFKNNAGTNFIDQIKFAYDQGFRAMEDNGMT